jgi:hypothetical protein
LFFLFEEFLEINDSEKKEVLEKELKKFKNIYDDLLNFAKNQNGVGENFFEHHFQIRDCESLIKKINSKRILFNT